MEHILCGRCRKPLGSNSTVTVMDTVEGVFSERQSLYCDNPDCTAEVYVVKETRKPLPWYTKLMVKLSLAIGVHRIVAAGRKV